MYINDKILVGKNDNKEMYLIPKMANRHGLITGASGSGKTITLKVLAESFSEAGIPVFLVDVKGDLAGMPFGGENSENINKRVNKLALDGFKLQGYPTVYYDIAGKMGHPIRTTVSNIGARLLARMLDLSDTGEEVLAVVFKIANDENLELIDLKDLNSMLSYVGDKRGVYSNTYGNISIQTITSIKRAVLTLEEAGGGKFFGKPDFNIRDFMQYDNRGYGYINILDAQTLFKDSTTYVIMLLWLLTAIYDEMPEVGDLDKPKLIFFFDEAHLIFSEMKDSVIKKLVQIVKLIRSKGVGLYFISQTPSDIKDEVLSQLGNRVEHVLRSYTKSDEKSIKAAADGFRPNPNFDTVEAIKSLGTGEALVSFQTENGEPSIVEKVTILPPQSRMGTITDLERDTLIKNSRIYGKYDKLIDYESAYEKIEKIKEKEIKELEKQKNSEYKTSNTTKTTSKTTTKTYKKPGRKKTSQFEKMAGRLVNKTVDSVGRKLGNAIFKGLFKK